MKTLYIIGNGFDIYHGLDTSYQAFGYFLQEQYTKLYDYLVQYYGLPELDIDDPESDYDILWSDFESALADLDFETILDDNTDSLPNYDSDEFRSRDLHTFQQNLDIIGLY